MSGSRKTMKRIWAKCIPLYCTSTNLNWWGSTKVVAMEGGGSICVDVTNNLHSVFGVT